MEFKIRKNVPIPAGATGRGPRVNYPFLKMEIGDSIFVPGMNVKKMSSQISWWKKNHNLNFTIRAAVEDQLNEENGETVKVEGVEVWLKDPAVKSNRGRKPGAAATAATETAPAPTTETPDLPSSTDPASGDAAETPVKTSGKGKGKTKAEAEDEY